MWHLRITYNPLPTLIFEAPETLDGEPGEKHTVSFRFINPKITLGTKISNLEKTLDAVYEQSKTLESASRQIFFPYLGVPIKELFGFNFNAFGGRFKGNLDILQDIVSEAGKAFDFLFPEGREQGKKYRNHEFNRILPLYLLPEYIRRLPLTLMISSGICTSDIIETALDFLQSRETETTDEGLSYLFNRLMLDNRKTVYYRFLEKQNDSISVTASVVTRLSSTIEQQQRDMLKMQAQIATLLKLVSSTENPKTNRDICDSIMALK